MARILSNYKWPEQRKKAGRPSLYPWDEWMDGKVREAVAGVDYKTKSTQFRQMLQRTASKKKMTVRYEIRTLGGREVTVFQFTPRTSPTPNSPTKKAPTKKATTRKVTTRKKKASPARKTLTKTARTK